MALGRRFGFTAWMPGIAALLALVAAACFALAATLWQRAALAEGVSPGDARGFLTLLANRVWLLGLLAQVVAVALQAAALDRGRVAIIQPLLVTSIVFALPLGYLLTGQVVTRRHVAGAVVVVAGLATFAAAGDPAGGVDDAPFTDWIVPLVVIVAVCAALPVIGRRAAPSSRAAVLGATAGVLYGLAATLMKPVVETWHAAGAGDVLGGWELWVMVVAGGVGFVIQQSSLATGRLVASVATVSVANPVVSVALGVIVLQERLDRTPAWRPAVAVLALAVALGGAVLISAAGQTERRVVPAAA
jgi:drug/metabolite transporter (DMT)-like permease